LLDFTHPFLVSRFALTWESPRDSQTNVGTRPGHDGTLHRYFWSKYMKASLFYRIAAVLLLLFALEHAHGFRQSDPNWELTLYLHQCDQLTLNAGV
jgi:hypothetical protein